MKIIIDTRWIRSLKIDGVANFTLNITKELLEIKENDYILLSNSSEVENFISDYVNKDLSNLFYRINSSVTSPRNIFELNKAIKSIKPDMFFSPCYSIYSPFIKCKQIGVVHDLIPLIFPEMFKNASLKFKMAYCNKFVIKNSLKYLDKVITVSNNTKKDIINSLNINISKIDIIVEGANIIDIIPDNIENILKKYDINKEFFLFVGRHELYKNIKSVIESYSKLDKSIQEKYNLVIIGAYNKSVTPDLFEMVSDLNIQDKVIFIESVMPDSLPYFYKSAKLLIHLSLYEGFGLTVLEAMKYGLPAIVSNKASMPEVAGDGAILVNPDDISEIINKITNLINDKSLYEDLIVKGLERSKIFTWEKSAKQITDIMKSI